MLFGITPVCSHSELLLTSTMGTLALDNSIICSLFTSIVSALSGVSIKNDIAMTGEITLRGRVLPIGGLKEKLLAAVRGGIKEVIIPKENKKDLADINEKEILDKIEIHFIDNATEILKKAFTSKILPYKVKKKDEVNITKKPINPKENSLRH